jgi:hypothetical protein
MDARKAFEAEVIAEAIGKSRKKWALLVLAFVVGAMAAAWLIRRAQSVEPPITTSVEPRQESPAEPAASS